MLTYFCHIFCVNTQSNQSFECGARRFRVPGSHQENEQTGVKKAVTCSKLLFLVRHHWDLELLVSRWSTESYTFVTVWGKFTLTLEDVASLTMLPLFGEANAMGIILEENDQTKLNYLSHGCFEGTGQVDLCDLAMIFLRGGGSRSGYVVDAFLSY